MRKPKLQRWQEIPDPGKAKVAEQLWKLIPRVHIKGGALPLADWPNEADRLELRKWLDRSGLADKLYNHSDLLEDPRPQLAEPYRRLAMSHLPLTFENRLLLLGLYLDWYLGLNETVPGARLLALRQSEYFYAAVVLLGGSFFVIGILNQGDSDPPGWPWLLNMLGFLMILWQTVSYWTITQAQGPRFLALYHYLCDSYGAPPLPPPPEEQNWD